MSSAKVKERTTLSALGFGAPTPTATAFPGAAPATNLCVLPRCEIKVEKCATGMKIWCKCDDEVACATVQELCKALCDGMCSCCCTMNGITICQCNLACGICKCEYTKDGCCITCLSGDKACCAIIQSCCDCIACCLEQGCCCYVSFGGTPVCCGTC